MHEFKFSPYWKYRRLYGWQCQVVGGSFLSKPLWSSRLHADKLPISSGTRQVFVCLCLCSHFVVWKGTHLCLPRWMECRSWGCGNADLVVQCNFCIHFGIELWLHKDPGSLCPFLASVGEGAHTGLYKVTPFNESWLWLHFLTNCSTSAPFCSALCNKYLTKFEPEMLQ